jgi:hypothetical protein
MLALGERAPEGTQHGFAPQRRERGSRALQKAPSMGRLRPMAHGIGALGTVPNLPVKFH